LGETSLPKTSGPTPTAKPTRINNNIGK